MLTTQKTEQDYINQVIKDRSDGYYGKYTLTFGRPVTLIHNRYNKKTYNKATVKLFTSGNALCYTFYQRTGYHLFSQVSVLDICSIERVPEEDKHEQRLQRAESLLRRIDSRCWDTIRYKTPEQISEEFCDSNLVPFSFIKRFKPYIRGYLKEKLEDAFMHQKVFTYRQEGVKRDLSVETKLCDDGVFRAWFSSEYSGCANGDYYLVISPTQAIYYEKD
ncbi:MAG: hypothetical protein JXI43_10615 [Tissierellales bacterium]|nr:hypothetical protein [Tissierellales bacterium]